MENNKPIEIFKVYSLLLEAKEQIFLSIQYASSLEDAFAMAKLEYEKLNPTKQGLNNPLIGSKIWLFTIKSVTDLIHGVVPIPREPMKFKRLKMDDIKKEQPIEEKEIQKEMIETIKKSSGIKFNKNYLMKTIIETKDLRSLENNKDLLTKNDIKYIKDQIKKKEDSPLDK